MGKIDDAVPFFGQNFNRIYPLIMVVYTIMVASNFFDRIMSYFGNWKIFKLGNEADDLDGFDPSGLMILQKGKFYLCFYLLWHICTYIVLTPLILFLLIERSSIMNGHKVGELVIPLARYFNNSTADIESGSSSLVSDK